MPDPQGFIDLVWRCHKGPQRELMFGDLGKVREIGWGGAKGGGKSALIGPFSLKHVSTYPEHARVLILREDYPQLSDLMEKMAPQCRAAGGRYNKTDKVWTFPKGATIRFGYFKGDEGPHWGKEFTLIIVDEVTRCIATEAEYLNLMLSLRNGHGIPGQIITLTNPGGEGHHWWQARFLSVPPREVQRDEHGLERVFIPARLSDNPTLDNDTPEGRIYRATLQSLGEAERRAFLLGDWSAFTGSVYNLEPAHIWTWAEFKERTGHDRPPADWNRYTTLDWGYARPFALYWYAVDYDGRAYVYREWYGVAHDANGKAMPDVGARLTADEVAEGMLELEAAELDAAGQVVKPEERIIERWTGPDLGAPVRGDHGAAANITAQQGGRTLESCFEERGIFWSYWTASAGSRLAGKNALHQRLAYPKGEDGKAADWPGIVFIREECPHAIRTLPLLPYDKHNPELVSKKAEDHAADSLTGFCKMNAWAPVAHELGDHDRLRQMARRNAARKSGQRWQAV